MDCDAMDRIDLSLFGQWPAGDDGLKGDVEAVFLERKSAEPVRDDSADFRLLLNEMMTEMRAQFLLFRSLREGARLGGEDGDEAAQKLARADMKAATDAMSLIVRTLEKIDQLQRQLAREREEAAERDMDGAGFEHARNAVRQLIETRAQERFDAWRRDYLAARTAQDAACAGADPPATAEGG